MPGACHVCTFTRKCSEFAACKHIQNKAINCCKSSMCQINECMDGLKLEKLKTIYRCICEFACVVSTASEFVWYYCVARIKC